MRAPLITKDYVFGTIDTLEARSIPRGSASKSLNWRTKVDKIELRRGYNRLGDENSGSGKITTLFVARKSDGVEIPFRTRGKKLEYYDSAAETWTEIGSDILGSDADGQDISMDEYHSLAGDQLFINSPYGPFLKIMLANPGSSAVMYNASKNHKGRIKIKQNRMTLWGRLADKTGVYLSHIDEQNYTTVSTEILDSGDGSEKTFTATLAFKAGGAKRTCFAIEVTDGVETFKDNNDGTLTGDKGGAGTINYMTGAISVTFNTAVGNGTNITGDYQWEDSTNGGICDFTYSSTRVAAEGAVFRQDEGGGTLQTIESHGEEEYCMHKKKTWVLELTADDTNASNLIYREKVGIPNHRAAVSTGKGIFFLDNSDEKDPQIRVLSIPPMMDKVLPSSISKGFKYKNKRVGLDLSDYEFDKAVTKEWGDLILVACRTSDVAENNRLIVYDKVKKILDVLDYWCSDIAIYGGTLIAGDPFTDNVYTLFSGFDDDDSLIPNYWEGKEDDLDFYGLKKVKKLVLKGEIAPEQKLKISVSIDNGAFVEIGGTDDDGSHIYAIEGDGDYVDTGKEISIGRTVIGSKEIGGGGGGVSAYKYEKEISLALDKFEIIKIRYEAIGLGYVSVSEQWYYDPRLKSQKIPKKYRT